MQFMSSRHTLAEFQPEDDLDNLFNRLSQVEPSGELIARILAHVGRLPVPSALPFQPNAPAGRDLDTLIVRNEKRGPS